MSSFDDARKVVRVAGVAKGGFKPRWEEAMRGARRPLVAFKRRKITG